MEIWPAIDLRDGKCVRLQQGDYNRETVFSDDPVAQAKQWADAGAECLHLVDLDGARDGNLSNRQSIAAIARETRLKTEVGGGIRTEESIRHLIDLGIDRLVIGTQAIKRPEWFAQMCEEFPHRLVLGIDARHGKVATDGWLETSEVSAVDLARQFASQPIAAIVYTDIETDGMLSGPNLAEMQTMQQASDIPVIASGGVTTAQDVSALAAIPVAGAIIGRALYEGTLALETALQIARGNHDATSDGISSADAPE